MIKIAITGPESTGKSVLSEYLSKELNGSLVKEYAREFLKNKKGYDLNDLDVIAETQFKMITNAFEQSSSVVFADTEMSVMKIWSIHKYGSVSSVIEKLFQKQEFDLYLLCYPDISWEPDPLREAPNKEERFALFKKYEDLLSAESLPYVVVNGVGKERNENTLRIIRDRFRETLFM